MAEPNEEPKPAEEKVETPPAAEEPKPEEKVEDPKPAEEPKPEGTPAKDKDPLEMTPDELEKRENELLEKGEEPPAEEKTEEKSEEKPDKKAEKPEEPEKKEEETPPEPRYDKDGNLITGDPLKDTQARLTREIEEKKRLERELADKKFEKFERLTPEKKDELKYDDPDAFEQYLEDERAYDQHEADKITAELLDAHEQNTNNVVEFVATVNGLDPSRERDSILSELRNPESEATKLMMGLNDHLEKNIRPDRLIRSKDENGNDVEYPLYSKEKLHLAYNAVYSEKIQSEMAKSIREKTLADIENAANGGSKLDRVESSASGPSSGQKTPEEYSQEEIFYMTPDQLEKLEKQYTPG